MKFCYRCQTLKSEEDFHKNSLRKDGLQTYCKACRKELDAIIYASGGEEYKARKRERQRELAKRNARLVFEYLRQHSCLDCGEADPVVLEFDHALGEKKYNLSDLILRYSGWETIRAEIEKCEVRCANCHRRRTAVARSG